MVNNVSLWSSCSTDIRGGNDRAINDTLSTIMSVSQYSDSPIIDRLHDNHLTLRRDISQTEQYQLGSNSFYLTRLFDYITIETLEYLHFLCHTHYSTSPGESLKRSTLNSTIQTEFPTVLWRRRKGIVGGRNRDRAAWWDSSCSAASYAGTVSGEGSRSHTGVLWNSPHRLARVAEEKN